MCYCNWKSASHFQLDASSHWSSLLIAHALIFYSTVLTLVWKKNSDALQSVIAIAFVAAYLCAPLFHSICVSTIYILQDLKMRFNILSSHTFNKEIYSFDNFSWNAFGAVSFRLFAKFLLGYNWIINKLECRVTMQRRSERDRNRWKKSKKRNGKNPSLISIQRRDTLRIYSWYSSSHQLNIINNNFELVWRTV